MAYESKANRKKRLEEEMNELRQEFSPALDYRFDFEETRQENRRRARRQLGYEPDNAFNSFPPNGGIRQPDMIMDEEKKDPLPDFADIPDNHDDVQLDPRLYRGPVQYHGNSRRIQFEGMEGVRYLDDVPYLGYMYDRDNLNYPEGGPDDGRRFYQGNYAYDRLFDITGLAPHQLEKMLTYFGVSSIAGLYGYYSVWIINTYLKRNGYL